MLKLFNSLGRQLETFEPLEGQQVRMYTCGPTVYNDAHIGNLRTFVFEDLLRRTLRYFGYDVTQVMNLTDVEDKIILRAAEAGLPIQEYTAGPTEAFFRDLKRLHVEEVEHYPRATDHIPEMIELIERLLERDYAYLADGSVFFRIAADEDYGRLSGIDLSQVRQGERVADDEYDKEDVRDFVLWKGVKPGEPSWDSPWGPGRPGWHIECSAMSKKYLGESFDIHCGGVDNLFPHHENEIAQSESAHGESFARFWLHAEHLVVDQTKMSKSLGNQFTLSDVVDNGVSPRSLRYLYLSVHYRQKLNFTFDTVAQADASLRRLDDMRRRLTSAAPAESGGDELVARSAEFQEEFRSALGDDLNSSAALGALFRFVRSINGAVDRGVTASEREAIESELTRADEVLGVLDPAEWENEAETHAAGLSDEAIDELIAARALARKERRFGDADAVRDQLTEQGIVLEDGPEGTSWHRS